LTLELILAAVFLLMGVVSGINSLRNVPLAENGRARFLIAVHEAAKAGFWLALGGFFLGFGLIEEPQGFQWFALAPVFMAGLRLLAAAFLARG
jgi:hypothetical protein